MSPYDMRQKKLINDLVTTFLKADVKKFLSTLTEL